MKKIKKLIIIGSGPAGYTSSIYASRYNLKPILITEYEEGSQIIKSNKIENWPGEYKSIKGIKLIKNMKKQSIKFNTKIINDVILDIEYNNKFITLIGKNNKYYCIALIIATGCIPKKLNLPKEKKLYGKGISTCAICDGPLYKNKNIAIVGGGNTAAEESLYLSKIVNKIYLIHRRNLTSEIFLINKIKKNISKKKIIFYKNYRIIKIYKKKEYLDSIKIKNIISKKKIKIKIDGLFIAIGYKPNTKAFKKKINLDKQGYIITNYKNAKYTSMTNINGIFAAGDVINNKFKQAITSSASGCIAAIEVQKYLEKKLK